MPSRQIHNGVDKKAAIAWLETFPMPSTMTLTIGVSRSLEQNSLQRLWLNEAAEQLMEYTSEEYRAYCKLHFGIPILRAEDEGYCEAYDRIIRPLSYEAKLEMMSVPLDFHVTRLMTTKQKSQYLDKMYQHFSGLGAKLTDPGRTWP